MNFVLLIQLEYFLLNVETFWVQGGTLFIYVPDISGAGAMQPTHVTLRCEKFKYSQFASPKGKFVSPLHPYKRYRMH